MNVKPGLSLILFRHAKSDWSTAAIEDCERPLTQRGMRAARTMGEFLAGSGQVPELALLSPARRTRQTLDLACRQGEWNIQAKLVEHLYLGSVETVLEIIRAQTDAPASMMLVGHEPSCSELAARLIGDCARIRFPTACMARIDLHARRWSDVAFACGELRWMVPPKLFPAETWEPPSHD